MQYLKKYTYNETNFSVEYQKQNFGVQYPLSHKEKSPKMLLLFKFKFVKKKLASR